MTSPVLKSVAPTPSVKTYSIGDDTVIILAFAPLVPPVIISPLVKFPTVPVIVICGAAASVEVDSESNTATNLNASARPRDMSLSPGLVPYASLTPVVTLTCFIKLVVLILWFTFDLNIVALSFTFAPLPKIVLSVIVIEAVPVPEIFESTLTICP